MNILGTEYQFKEDETIIEKGIDGECAGYTKEIRIRPKYTMLGASDNPADKAKRYNEVFRNEVIHAFFTESGLEQYSDDEVLVNWIAIQFPKMLKIFQEHGCTE